MPTYRVRHCWPRHGRSARIGVWRRGLSRKRLGKWRCCVFEPCRRCRHDRPGAGRDRSPGSFGSTGRFWL